MADAPGTALAGDTAEGAPSSGLSSIMQVLTKRTDLLFAVSIIGILIVLLVPVPTFFLDVLLGLSITFAVLILMTVLFLDKPLDFSTFPTILLIAAIFRLSLNIASTRLILSEGHTGSAAAGHVIEAFGGFVMGGSAVIGAIIFAILTIINFVVVTKGSGRIAEVAARFSLDAMPGKQMAIDADLSAGLIDETQAKDRRKQLEDESTFFGSMDGASKFVRGDAIAGLLITFINLIGGMVIGMVQRDLDFGKAANTYTVLTIGDGLVSQIPALVVSVSAGMLVSKAGISGTADKVIFRQMGRSPQALGVVSAVMFGRAMLPSIPAIPFLAISGGIGWMAWKAHLTIASGEADTQSQKAAEVKQQQSEASSEEQMSSVLKIDPLRIELGYALLPLINYEKGNKLADQVKGLRKQMAKDTGFILPSVRIQDNMQLESNEYVLRVKDMEAGRGSLRADMLMVMNPTGEAIGLPGEDTQEPAFGLPAKWVPENMRDEALFKNLTVVDPPTVITTHLTEIVKDNITELLTYSETKKLLDAMEEEHKKLIEDTIPDKITINGVQRILQNLLSEKVSIRDLPLIVEAIAEAATLTKNTTMMTEHVRSRLARHISNENLSREKVLELVTLSPTWEQVFTEGLVGEGEEKQLSIPPTQLQEFINSMKRAYQPHVSRGINPVLLVSPRIRPYVRSVIDRFQPNTVVMSQNEVHSRVKIKTLGQV